MKGYLWRILYEGGDIKEVTAPNIMAALLMTANPFRQEGIVSCVRMEEIHRPEAIYSEQIGAVTA